MDPSDASDIPTDSATQNSSSVQDWGMKRLKVYAQVTSMSLAFALAFGAGGYFIGKKYDEELLFTMIAVLISYPLAQYFIYKTVQPTKSK